MSVDNKEYKVITSNTPAFGSSAKLKQILAEEAQAGWDLVEIIDANKIKVGRDKSNRSSDGNRSIDPYRISVGINQIVYFGVAAVVTVVVIWAIIQAAAMSVT
jgi:t-SNARE complex subunit (syntaxin)